MSKAYDYKNIIETIDGAASQFESCTTASEKILFEAAMNAARELDYDPKTGKIKTTTANIARLARIKAKLTNAAASNIYLQGVRKLAETFGAIHDEQLQYFRSNFAAKTLDEKSVRDKYAALKKATIENTIEGLTGQGLQANVTDAISRMLMTAVTSGEKYADLTEQLHQELISSQGKTGSLARYANTYATTAMTQYAGRQNRMFTDDLDIKWFRYVGSTIETTRRFCELLTQKEYIHISEIPEILKGRIEIGGEIKTCPINPKTELPYGLIEGTTPENFAVNVGGWNCRHQLVPIADEAVPKNIRENVTPGETTTTTKKTRTKNKQNTVTQPTPPANSKYINLIDEANRENIEFIPVQLLKNKLTDEEIISRIGGLDQTEGACSSLAFAYAANRAGLDVLDYRGGKSALFFRTIKNIEEIAKISKSDGYKIMSGMDALKTIETGKEYYLHTGAHAAIVRKISDKEYQYLELQGTDKENGWHKLDSKVFARRFLSKGKSNWTIVIDTEKMTSDAGYRDLMGYMNTAKNEQLKGDGGSIK